MTSTQLSDAIIRMVHVQKRYDGKLALKDITFDIAKNDYLFHYGLQRRW